MGRQTRLWLFVLHLLFGGFFIHSGLEALRTGDASGMRINDRPVETPAEMRSFVYWGAYGVTRGVLGLFVPFSECAEESDEDDPTATQLKRKEPGSITLLRLAFVLYPGRGQGCEKDEPWGLGGTGGHW